MLSNFFKKKELFKNHTKYSKKYLTSIKITNHRVQILQVEICLSQKAEEPLSFKGQVSTMQII